MVRLKWIKNEFKILSVFIKNEVQGYIHEKLIAAQIQHPQFEKFNISCAGWKPRLERS